MKNTQWHKNKCWIEGAKGFIELRNNKNKVVGLAEVDREDLIRCSTRKWRLNNTRNVLSTNNGNVTTLQRFILNKGKLENQQDYVSHLNFNPLNCCKINLYVGKGLNQYDRGW